MAACRTVCRDTREQAAAACSPSLDSARRGSEWRASFLGWRSGFSSSTRPTPCVRSDSVNVSSFSLHPHPSSPTPFLTLTLPHPHPSLHSPPPPPTQPCPTQPCPKSHLTSPRPHRHKPPDDPLPRRRPPDPRAFPRAIRAPRPARGLRACTPPPCTRAASCLHTRGRPRDTWPRAGRAAAAGDAEADAVGRVLCAGGWLELERGLVREGVWAGRVARWVSWASGPFARTSIRAVRRVKRWECDVSRGS